METNKRQYYGIKYPFTNDGYQKFFLDANDTLKDKVRSQLMHVIFTPKGQKIRDPEFGTDLIRFIFDPSEEMTWEGVKAEISDSVQRFCTNVKLSDIQVARSDEDPMGIYVRVDYSVVDGNKLISDAIGVRI